MKIFIICTVRNANEQYREKLATHAVTLRNEGHTVYVPTWDTDQSASGINICRQNVEAIKRSDEVHIFYSPESQGTHFDMGVSFALGKKIKVVESIPLTEGKSYQRMLKEWEANDGN